MAFTLYAYDTENNYNHGFAINLTNGAPYKLERFEDAGGAPIVRLGQTGPTQHGRTDLGYRLQPRILRLTVLFTDDDDMTLDPPRTNRRDTLHSILRPSHQVWLRLVRDDGSHRLLACYTEQIEIDLLPEHYPARLNRATITLRAANPLPYNPTVKTATFARSSDWATGGTAIPSANVLEFGNLPDAGQAWTYAHPQSLVNAWSIVIRTGSVSPAAGTAFRVAYTAGSGVPTSLASHDVRIISTQGAFYMGTGYAFAGSATMTAGTHNYIQTYDGTVWRNYRSGTVLERENTQELFVTGVPRRWRGWTTDADTWPAEIPYYAIYNIELNSAQRIALNDAINADIAGAEIGTVTTVNLGDVYEYPLITIRGPINNPVLTNLATGDKLDFTGGTLTTGQQLTIDLRTGLKSATGADGTNYAAIMGTPVQLASFGLAPAPVATGGTNQIRVTGGSMTSDTRVTVTYYDRYVSF